jgi:hypothetical protein
MTELSSDLHTCGTCGYVWNRTDPRIVNVQRGMCATCITNERNSKVNNTASELANEYVEPAGWKSFAGQYSSYWD